MIDSLVKYPKPPSKNEINLDVTPVFHKNWKAINETNTDGSRKYRYIINTGSSRSSKTFSLIDVYDIYCRSFKNKRCTVWRDTKKSCKDTVLNDAQMHFRNTKRIIDFNVTESIFKYPGFSTFEIHGTDDTITVHGLNQSVAWLNEPYKISRGVFDQIDQRTEDFILIDWNPTMGHWVEDVSKDSRAIVIHSTFNDNSFCPPEQKNKILSYQPVSMCELVMSGLLTEKEANEYNISLNEQGYESYLIKELSRCIENERKKSASEYNWSVYGLGLKAERPNRIFHWNEISLQDYLQLQLDTYYYSDWGAVDPWAIGECKYMDGCLYIREKNYESENLLRARLDPSELYSINSQDEGLISYMFRKLQIGYDNYIICDPNRVTKVRALRDAGYDYAIAPPKPPGSIIDGIDLLNNLKVFYTSDSPNIKYEQENYSRQVDRYGIVLEEPEDVDNHHMDGARYVGLFLQGQGVINVV